MAATIFICFSRIYLYPESTCTQKKMHSFTLGSRTVTQWNLEMSRLITEFYTGEYQVTFPMSHVDSEPNPSFFNPCSNRISLSYLLPISTTWSASSPVYSPAPPAHQETHVYCKSITSLKYCLIFQQCLWTCS